MRTAIYVAIAGLIVLAGLIIFVKLTAPDPRDCNSPYPMAFLCKSGDGGIDPGDGVDRIAVAGRVL